MFRKGTFWGRALGRGKRGKIINPPSLLHCIFLSPVSPICVYFASFCETDPKKNILAAIKCRLCSNRYRHEKTAALKIYLCLNISPEQRRVRSRGICHRVIMKISSDISDRKVAAVGNETFPGEFCNKPVFILCKGLHSSEEPASQVKCKQTGLFASRCRDAFTLRQPRSPRGPRWVPGGSPRAAPVLRAGSPQLLFPARWLFEEKSLG